MDLHEINDENNLGTIAADTIPVLFPDETKKSETAETDFNFAPRVPGVAIPTPKRRLGAFHSKRYRTNLLTLIKFYKTDNFISDNLNMVIIT